MGGEGRRLRDIQSQPGAPETLSQINKQNQRRGGKKNQKAKTCEQIIKQNNHKTQITVRRLLRMLVGNCVTHWNSMQQSFPLLPVISGIKTEPCTCIRAAFPIPLVNPSTYSWWLPSPAWPSKEQSDMVPTPGIEPAGSGLPQVLTVAVDVRLACIIMHAFTCSSFQGMFSLPRLTTPRYSESRRSLGSKNNSFRIFSNRISDLGWKNHREWTELF